MSVCIHSFVSACLGALCVLILLLVAVDGEGLYNCICVCVCASLLLRESEETVQRIDML